MKHQKIPEENLLKCKLIDVQRLCKFLEIDFDEDQSIYELLIELQAAGVVSSISSGWGSSPTWRD
jgi:hypothetical protein